MICKFKVYSRNVHIAKHGGQILKVPEGRRIFRRCTFLDYNDFILLKFVVEDESFSSGETLEGI